jgi:hypothetical protein
MISLSPKAIVTNSDDCKVRFKKIVSKLQSIGQLDIRDCDDILEQNEKFVNEAKLNPEFQKFDKTTNRIDCLYYSIMSDKIDYRKLWSVLKKLLLLSHGQASVERGFSINKDVSDTNIKSTNLVARVGL